MLGKFFKETKKSIVGRRNFIVHFMVLLSLTDCNDDDDVMTIMMTILIMVIKNDAGTDGDI